MIIFLSFSSPYFFFDPSILFFLLLLSVYWQRWAVSIFSVNFTWPVLQDKISQNCATFCHIKCNFFYFTSIICIYLYTWIMCESQITNMIMPISYSLVSNFISTSFHNLRTFYLLIFFSFLLSILVCRCPFLYSSVLINLYLFFFYYIYLFYWRGTFSSCFPFF